VILSIEDRLHKQPVQRVLEASGEAGQFVPAVSDELMMVSRFSLLEQEAR